MPLADSRVFNMYIFLIVLLLLSINTFAQSRRAGQPAGRPAAAEDQNFTGLTAREMFDEANGYSRKKFEEFEQKKVPFSESLRLQTEKEKKQLAAKYASVLSTRDGLSADDLYYFGLLHWISENMEGTIEAFSKYLEKDDPDTERRQRSRSIVSVANAKIGRLAEAEKLRMDYDAGGPQRSTEISRMNVELAKAYIGRGDNAAASPYAERAYKASKALLTDPTARQRALDEMLDSGILLFESYRDRAMNEEADAALEDIRTVATSIGSSSLYYYATDKLVSHQIETGRKTLGMETYLTSLIRAGKELDKAQATDAQRRIKAREKHYKLMGEAAPPLLGIDKWFPGEPITLSSLKGNVILLDFWATWCAPCFEAFPHLTQWHEEHSRDGLVILGITRYYGRAEGFSVDEPNEIEFLKRFRQKYRLPYDFVVMKGQQTQIIYGATALPTAVLIDRNGVVRHVEVGTSSSRIAELRAKILKLLAE